MKIGVIVQTRLTSTRLPEKVLLPLPANSKTTALDQVIKRLKACNNIDEIIIATTINKCDEKVVEAAELNGVKWFRGDEHDVLSRFYYAAIENQLEVVVRVTSDCPLIDPAIIDDTIAIFNEGDWDYIFNFNSYPHGFAVEVFTFKALEKTFNEATKKIDREAVALYMEEHPDKFKVKEIFAPEKYQNHRLRVTLDTKDDYILLCQVYDYLYREDQIIKIEEILSLFEKKPWLYEINSSVRQKSAFNSLKEEVVEAIKILELQDLDRAAEYFKSKLSEV
ncbi:MAG: hypothetical protein A2Y40_02085 [Candidatus Margulisbacteria bacterium GWF2_35_9]|nr:MAG: hypothetical protein A2Y40_02085 [Candidatus Margulisbacteria bacterium GWF2_35_9]